MDKLSLDFDQFTGLVGKICREIHLSGWDPDYVVGITRGGLLPAVMISHYLDLPMHALKVSFRDDSDLESNLWMAEDAYDGKNILIVDDINDSGATINWIMEDWPSGCYRDDERWKSVWGNNVRVASIVENQATRSKIKTSFVGMEINKAEKDVWIDFPYESWWER